MAEPDRAVLCAGSTVRRAARGRRRHHRRQRRGAEPGARPLRRRRAHRPGRRPGAALGRVLDGCDDLARPAPHAHLGVELADDGGRRRPVGRRHRGGVPSRTEVSSSEIVDSCPQSGGWGGSAVLGVGEVEAAAGVPLRALVAVGRDAARVLEHAGEVQQVPGHERGVAVGEVVLRPARAGIEVGRPGPGLADPAGVGLGRDDVAEVLQRVEDVHRAVLDAVLVAGDEAAADAPVVGVLAVLVQQVRVAVQALDHLRAHRRLLTEPDRACTARGCRPP